jgi:hypothetical protein
MRALLARLGDTEGIQMRTGIGMAVVVAIGLIWSVAVLRVVTSSVFFAARGESGATAGWATPSAHH